MGKSAVTWRWFHERAPASLAGRFWWSFYEADAALRPVHHHCTGIRPGAAGRRGHGAVAVGPGEPPPRRARPRTLPPRARWLGARPDRLRRTHHAHLADDDLDQRTANALDRRHRLRQTIDPRAGEFLRKLCGVRWGRTLVTTRLLPSALQTVTGQPLPGSAAWFLGGMRTDDAIALWRAMGVSGDEAELERLFASIDHYPLLIRALAGEPAPLGSGARREGGAGPIGSRSGPRTSRQYRAGTRRHLRCSRRRQSAVCLTN